PRDHEGADRARALARILHDDVVRDRGYRARRARASRAEAQLAAPSTAQREGAATVCREATPVAAAPAAASEQPSEPRSGSGGCEAAASAAVSPDMKRRSRAISGLEEAPLQLQRPLEAGEVLAAAQLDRAEDLGRAGLVLDVQER